MGLPREKVRRAFNDLHCPQWLRDVVVPMAKAERYQHDPTKIPTIRPLIALYGNFFPYLPFIKTHFGLISNPELNAYELCETYNPRLIVLFEKFDPSILQSNTSALLINCPIDQCFIDQITLPDYKSCAELIRQYHFTFLPMRITIKD